MTFLLSTVLTLAALVAIAVGVTSDSYWAFVVGVALSGLSILFVWRRTKVAENGNRRKPAPVDVRSPNWNQPAAHRVREETAPPLPSDSEIGILKYDDLVAAEVLPSLETLSIEQLQAVIEREKQGLGREAIIRRAARLIGLTTGEIKLDLRLDSIEHAGMRDAMRKERSLEKEGPDLTL